MATETESDDGKCCVRLTVRTRAWSDANGLPDPPGVVAVAEVTREDGMILPFQMRTTQALASFVREIDPPILEMQALDEELPALLAELRAHLADCATHALAQPDSAVDAATVH